MAAYENSITKRTDLGELILRCRKSLAVPGAMVYEVKLNDEFLMSSLVNDSERALARLALDEAGDQTCDVLLGGLGLGYAAAEALTYDTVRRLDVVEVLEPVIDWHRRKIVPAAHLLDDPRCRIKLSCDVFLFSDGGSCLSAAPTSMNSKGIFDV